MIDVERLVRDALARHEVEMPTPDPLEAHPVAVRARRRQVLNGFGVVLAALVITLAAVSGFDALVRADRTMPADEPEVTPTPTLPNDLGAPIVGPFEAPPQAPIVVGSDRTNGSAWMLSTSADGRCIAFTDA